MKEFDLNKIGKEMPYSAPSQEFFEQFTSDLLEQVASIPEPKRKVAVFSLRRSLMPIISIAAVIAVVVTLMLNMHNSTKVNYDYIISDNIEESVASFLDNLSDEELEMLVAQNSYENDFYSNLLNE
ncbi:MAG: hypothetical protein SNH73_01090 [Rikenellaceae bacterium]